MDTTLIYVIMIVALIFISVLSFTKFFYISPIIITIVNVLYIVYGDILLFTTVCCGIGIFILIKCTLMYIHKRKKVHDKEALASALKDL